MHRLHTNVYYESVQYCSGIKLEEKYCCILIQQKGWGVKMTDSEWILLVKESPQEAYKALIDQYGNLIYAIVLNKLKSVASREDIEDCVSDVFVEVFQNAENYSPLNGTLKVYLSTIAKRTAIDAYRKLTNRYNRSASIEDNELILPPSEDNPENETESKLFNGHMWELIKKLGEPDSIILIRQYFYEQTAKEIAHALQMTAAAVQKRSVRARQKLKEILSKEMNINGKDELCEQA